MQYIYGISDIRDMLVFIQILGIFAFLFFIPVLMFNVAVFNKIRVTNVEYSEYFKVKQ